MTLIGKSIFGLWLSAWPYQICTWTCRLSLCGISRKVKNKKTKQKNKYKHLIGSPFVCCAALVVFYIVYMRHFCTEPFCPLVATLHIAAGSLGRYRFWRWFFFHGNTAVLAQMGGVELQSRSQCLAADTRYVLSWSPWYATAVQTQTAW